MAARDRPSGVRERRPTSADGILVVDKPAGLTSHDVVSQLRRLCGTRTVGHGGTLDPLATGVLICGIGKGTKLLTYVSGADKAYGATIRLGIGTASDDADGEVTSAVGADLARVTAGLAEAVAALTGDIMQVPTTVSALKVAGERAYALARQGKDVQLSARPVRVASFQVTGVHPTVLPRADVSIGLVSHASIPPDSDPKASGGYSTDSVAGSTRNLTSCRNLSAPELANATIAVVDVDVSVTVSSGTYVRALARDLGAALGVGGHLIALRRTWVGGTAGLPGFSLADAMPLAEIEAIGDAAFANGEALPTLPLAQAAGRFLPTRQLSAGETADLGFGRFIEPSLAAGEAAVAGIGPDGGLAAILTNIRQRGQLRAKPSVVFAAGSAGSGASGGSPGSSLGGRRKDSAGVSRPAVSVASPTDGDRAALTRQDAGDAGASGAGHRGAVVTFGSFDGVQRGHQALIGEVNRIARKRGLSAVAITFDPHPGVFHGSRPGLRLIQGVADRVLALKAAGAGQVEVIHYDHDFAAQTPEEFVRNYLVNRYHAEVVVLGSDARFGAKNAGDLALLRKLGEKYGFEVITFAGLGPGDGETRWSSTLARHAIAAGNMPQARQVLGRHHTITGVVVHGDHRGRTLGFPTANLADIVGAVPADGVYAGWLINGVANGEAVGGPNAELGGEPIGERWPAAISIGTNPTFTDAHARRVEAFVLDRTDLDLYGQQVKLEFAQQIRPTEKFDSVAALVAQMHDDVAKVRVATQTEAQ